MMRLTLSQKQIESIANCDTRICTYDDCDKQTRSAKMTICNMHYQRELKAKSKCTYGTCDKPLSAKGLCMMHYKRQRNGQDMDAPELGYLKAQGCSYEGCEETHHGNGYCVVHNARNNRHGSPDGFATGPCPGCGDIVKRNAEVKYCDDCAAGRYARNSRKRQQRLKLNNAVMTEDDWRDSKEYREFIANDPCVYCGEDIRAIDHIVPVLNGGNDMWTNYAPICKPCNSSKRDKEVLQFMLYKLERR